MLKGAIGRNEHPPGWTIEQLIDNHQRCGLALRRKDAAVQPIDPRWTNWDQEARVGVAAPVTQPIASSSGFMTMSTNYDNDTAVWSHRFCAEGEHFPAPPGPPSGEPPEDQRFPPGPPARAATDVDKKQKKSKSDDTSSGSSAAKRARKVLTAVTAANSVIASSATDNTLVRFGAEVFGVPRGGNAFNDAVVLKATLGVIFVYTLFVVILTCVCLKRCGRKQQVPAVKHAPHCTDSVTATKATQSQCTYQWNQLQPRFHVLGDACQGCWDW